MMDNNAKIENDYWNSTPNTLSLYKQVQSLFP